MIGLLLLRNRGLAAKDILLDLTGGCFRQLGHKLDSLGTLEVRQMITSVIAQRGTLRSSSPWTTNTWARQLAMLSGSDFIERKPLMMQPWVRAFVALHVILKSIRIRF